MSGAPTRERLPAIPAEPVCLLLVDDQPENLLALEATLAPLGQRLVTASSGREALRHLLTQDFAVILLDVVMPDMDGFETAQLIRERERSRGTPLIFLTGLSRGPHPELRGYAMGAVDYLLKPFEPAILRSKVSVFVELYRKTELVRRQAEALRDAQQREHARELLEAQRRVEAERLRSETNRNQQRWLEAVIAALPMPLALVEPGSGHTLLANRAAQGLAGGCLAYREARALHADARFLGADGRLLEDDALPLMRAARGEVFQASPVEWNVGGQRGSVLASSERLPRMHGRPETMVLGLLDVTALRAAARHDWLPLPLTEHIATLEAQGEDTGPLTRLIEVLRNLPGLSTASPGQEREEGSVPAEESSQAGNPPRPAR
ncbi:response regulator [Myxococcus xanthus]|uniref:response regulator n=1 Tax=Myxococcus xanthus TaxID=34 RepID=UPI001127B7BC|nr:response regulator [Myxococcus xanthus]QDE95019.1 response regulator [Myxococcus xanthus]